ncbi:MAG: metallophosphoesterase [Chloroflexota bacterium]
MSTTRPAGRHLRTIAAAVVAGAGAILALAGLLVLLDPNAPGRGDTPATPTPAAMSTPAPTGARPGTAAPSMGAPSRAPAASAAAASPAATPSPAVLLAVGDIARCGASGDEATGALAAQLPGVIATLGDTAYSRGTAAELRDCFGASWGQVRDRIRWAVSGNHDDLTDAGAPLRAYMGEAVARDGLTYFSDTLGSWHVIVLDSNCGVVAGGCGAGSPQARWLAADLASSPTACTVALYHHPRFSSGYHHGSSSMSALWSLLADGGVDLALNGHEHDYERFAPQDANGKADPATGVTELVVGTGGGALRGFGKAVPNSVVRRSTVYGLVEVTLSDGGWTARFLGPDGAVIDEASGTCH